MLEWALGILLHMAVTIEKHYLSNAICEHKNRVDYSSTLLNVQYTMCHGPHFV